MMAVRSSLLLLGSLLCMCVLVNGSFFVSTHQKGRYVKPPSTGKRSMTISPLFDPVFSALSPGHGEPLEQEKRSCQLIFKTIEANIDRILSNQDNIMAKEEGEPVERAIRYVGRNMDLLEKCLSRLEDN